MKRLSDLEAWVLLVRVVETGSFAKAAESVGIPQSAVSKAIGRLERRLGTTLLHKTSNGFSLTETGAAAVEKAKLTPEEGQATESEASGRITASHSLIRVVAPTSFGELYLAPFLPAFLERHPDIHVELSFSDRFVDAASDGFDLAVQIGEPSDSSLIARKLCAVPRRLVATPGYLERHGRPRHPRDLGGHECLVYAARSTLDVWHFSRENGEAHSVIVEERRKIGDSDSLTATLMGGHGVAPQPEFLICDDLAAGRLEEVLGDWQIEGTTLNLAMPPERQRCAHVAALIDHFDQTLSPLLEPSGKVPAGACRETGMNDRHQGSRILPALAL